MRGEGVGSREARPVNSRRMDEAEMTDVQVEDREEAEDAS